MKPDYDVIIVGGGIAGLTSAAYLSRAGQRTLVIERREKTGGLVNTFWHEGFAFDGGIRAFEDSGILLPMLKNLGIDISFVQSPVSLGIADRWVTLTSKDSLAVYESMLMATFPDHTADVRRITREIKQVMGYMDVLYGIENPLFLEDMRDPKYLVQTLLPWLVKYQWNIRKVGRLNAPIYEHLRGLTTNTSLMDMIAQHFFKNTPTFFALSYFGLYLDYIYPMGGTKTLAEQMTQFIVRSGGEIRTGISVQQVDSESHQILLSGGEKLSYRKLVWAADQKTLYRAIGEPQSGDIERQRERVEAGEGSDSILTVFLGLNLDPEVVARRTGPHAFYTPVLEGLSSLPPWRERIESNDSLPYDWVAAYLEKTTYEISCPVLRDHSLAPEGQAGLTISTLFDYEVTQYFAEAGAYEALKEFCIKTIVDIMTRTVFPEIEHHLMFTICATPMTIEELSGNSQGAITGWSFAGADLPSESRFKQIAHSVVTPIPDVVQCGQWTFSPAGLPISIVTGKLAADRLLKELKK